LETTVDKIGTQTEYMVTLPSQEKIYTDYTRAVTEARLLEKHFGDQVLFYRRTLTPWEELEF
jgi:hypothetical protein